eukprot:1186817-Prorocentrum_minimum.AAC.2
MPLVFFTFGRVLRLRASDLTDKSPPCPSDIYDVLSEPEKRQFYDWRLTLEVRSPHRNSPHALAVDARGALPPQKQPARAGGPNVPTKQKVAETSTAKLASVRCKEAPLRSSRSLLPTLLGVSGFMLRNLTKTRYTRTVCAQTVRQWPPLQSVTDQQCASLPAGGSRIQG